MEQYTGASQSTQPSIPATAVGIFDLPVESKLPGLELLARGSAPLALRRTSTFRHVTSSPRVARKSSIPPLAANVRTFSAPQRAAATGPPADLGNVTGLNPVVPPISTAPVTLLPNRSPTPSRADPPSSAQSHTPPHDLRFESSQYRNSGPSPDALEQPLVADARSGPAPYRSGFQPRGAYRLRTDEFLQVRSSHSLSRSGDERRISRRLEKVIPLRIRSCRGLTHDLD